MEHLLFDDWLTLLRVLLGGVVAYFGLIAFLRISGKRTLAKMNAFDLVVTVSLGSTLATTVLSQDVTVAQGCAAFALLIGLQFLITWASVRSRWVRRVVAGDPALLRYRGSCLSDAMRQSRVTEGEIRAAVRSQGVASLEDVEAVVLETDGSFSVVRRGNPRRVLTVSHCRTKAEDGTHVTAATAASRGRA